MGIYRKIEKKMWGDARFRRLTPIPPCGQGLWFWLLTGPPTGPIPGMFSMGEAGMAELLRWPVEAFRKAFAEVLQEGLAKADPEAPLIWLPNAIRHNKPQSPNVVRSWEDAWEELPECELKVSAWKGLKDFLDGMGEGFQEAFLEACPKPLANQEQEQEQEQEQPGRASEQARTAAGAEIIRWPGKRPPTTLPVALTKAIPGFASLWRERMKCAKGKPNPSAEAKQLAGLADRLGSLGADAIRRHVEQITAAGWQTAALDKLDRDNGRHTDQSHRPRLSADLERRRAGASEDSLAKIRAVFGESS